MTKEQKEYIIELIKEGKELPEDFKYLLFPTKQKEYELVYAGKMRKEDILANEDGVFPVPLQIEKVFNGNEYEAFDDNWKNMIVFGDNLQFLKTIHENKDPIIRDKVKGKVKLIYIDPPFATADEFQNKEGAKAYNDKKKGAEFVEFLRKRLIVAREILADDGTIYVHLDQKMSHYIKVIMDEIFGKEKLRNEIIWAYKSPSPIKTSFQKKHDLILWYSKNNNYIFNHKDILVSYDDATLKRRLYAETTKGGISFSGKNYDEYEKGRVPNDWWSDIPSGGQISRKELLNYPTQKPEKLLERIIKASTNKDDIVLDFFGGSGTTMAVAEKLGRRWISCDLGKLSYFTMQKRILQIQNSKDLDNPKKKYGKKAKSFITASLGSYDLEKTFQLEREQYINFVAGLFEIELKSFKVSGFAFDGKKDNYPVVIYDYKRFRDSSIDENYLNTFHSSIGKKLGSRVYIVAPINYINFVDDYIEIDDTRYYFLKIPYHIINELHKMPFVKVRQPQSKSKVNDIEEAKGFHFKRTPEVEVDIKVEKNEVTILIKSFKTKELNADKTKEEKQKEEFENLSALFIDKTYNGKAFEMDEALFIDELLPKKKKGQTKEEFEQELKELSQKGIEKSFNRSEIGDMIMLVFTDIFGNDVTKTFKIG